MSGNKYAGLIANIGADSSITDLHIRKSYINGVWAAAFVGATNGTAGISSGEVVISGCSADDTVQVTGTRTAGIIGCALAKITVSDSYSSAVLGGTATKGGAYADVWGPIRQRREDWEKHLPDVYEILRVGSETARRTAAATLHDVRHEMCIRDRSPATYRKSRRSAWFPGAGP